MKQKAVFLDRDGVINDDTGHYYIYKPEDFRLNTGVVEGLKLLSNAGYMLIIVSNQGGVAKGIYSEDDISRVHEKLTKELKKHSLKIDAIYYCPHHDSVSECNCRKPKPGMILNAIKEFDINPQESYLIGDSERDITAGEQAGLKECFLIEKNSSIIPVCKTIIKSSTDE
jgi:D-glycero-D-manno-heptose 1,7-bisphosphate phosphatase